MFDNVIVGVGGAEGGRDALRLAEQLTSPLGRLTLAHVQVVMRRPEPDSEPRSLAADRLAAWQHLRLLRDAAGREARPLCIEAVSVAAGLHEAAVRHAADLLVVGATRRDGYDRAFVGDDTRAVLENAPCAVAVAPIGYATRAHALDQIGAAYDGSPGSEQAVALARRLARERGAELSAFQVVPEPIDARSLVDPQPQTERDLASARRRIAALGDLEPRAAAGDVLEELARYGASVDLVVVGPHRYRPIDHILDGSTAQRLADVAPCPLLVCRAERRARSGHRRFKPSLAAAQATLERTPDDAHKRLR